MNLMLIFLFIASSVLAQSDANYNVLAGKLHKSGKVRVHILPETAKFKVQMDYDVKKKDWVPVPSKLLKGKTVMEFPDEFKTEAGYQNLEKTKEHGDSKSYLEVCEESGFREFKECLFHSSTTNE